MARRFLTAEDVRAHGAGDIVVDAGTVVTYQALELAESLGVAIRTGSGGAYREPVPDRGPDANLAARNLPQLPEPQDDAGAAHGAVVTVVGRDRPNVLSEVTSAIGEAGANIRDISQRTIEGYFHTILTVDLPPGAGFDALAARVQCLGGPDDYVVRVMHERVFRFMHRV